MQRFFDLLLMLYPADYRETFGAEMRGVFLQLAEARRPFWWFALAESQGMISGAIVERVRRLRPAPVSLFGGVLCAAALHLLVYTCLLPPAFGQAAPSEGATAVELARTIYSHTFTGLREAKTMDDLRRLIADLEAPDWVSVDRFGRTVLTRADAERELESLLAIPGERRGGVMDVIWAGRDGDRLAVVAWMMPRETVEDGHRVTRATLIRDILVRTGDGWRRVRHDKLLPDNSMLAVDGVPRIVPPLADRVK